MRVRPEVWCVGMLTPPRVEVALPAVFGRVATKCGGGKDGEVCPYGVPKVTVVVASVDFEEVMLRAVEPE